MSTDDSQSQQPDGPTDPSSGDGAVNDGGSSLLDAAGQLLGDPVSTEGTGTDSCAMEATLEEAIVKRLGGLDIHEVVLFGSHAWGQPGTDSDVDLLVVLDEEDTPKDSAERATLHQRVARRLRDVERDVPIDLIVYTRPMYQKFLERDSMFARKVSRKGQILYEERG